MASIWIPKAPACYIDQKSRGKWLWPPLGLLRFHHPVILIMYFITSELEVATCYYNINEDELLILPDVNIGLVYNIFHMKVLQIP